MPGKRTLVEGAAAEPLPEALRSRLEAALATDLSGVRVREDRSVAAMGARAYARGIELLFAPGAYQPETPEGQALIAHEVVHLVQQAEGRVAARGQLGGAPVNTEASLEREADELGARALRGEPVRTAGAAPRAARDAPIQGMFEDLGKLFDPVIHAAGELWDTITGKGDQPEPGGLRVGDHAIVTDPDARLRDPAAGWASTGATIPPGTEVVVRELDGKYVRLEATDGSELGWTKGSNLDQGAGTKGNGKAPDPAAPDAPGPAPELPKTDEAWQALMAEARAGVTLTEHYAVQTRALNPDLLMAIRTSGLDKQDELYDVLTDKHEKTKGKDASELTPGRLAYRLGEELVARAEATAAVPGLLDAKRALIDKVAPDGTVDISKSAGGTLRVQLGKGLAPAGREAIDAWIKGHYQGNRLALTAAEVTELRALATSAVQAMGKDPARDARIAELQAAITACEARVRALLRTKASETKSEKRRALWSKLSEIAEADGVFVDRTLASYAIEHEDGSVGTLDPALAISVNYLNPGGFKNGGGAYDDAAIDDVLAGVYAGDPKQADKTSAAKKFIHTLNRNEGGPASMNTWDGEIVSAGPGLSGSGRLQKSMFEYKAADPAGFHDALGKFGVDIVRAGKKGNPYFTVRVPIDERAIPEAMRGQVTPGQIIVGSDSTGASKSSDAYEECKALRYISKDPVLMGRFMYAGKHSYERFLLKEAAASMQKAESFSFLVGTGPTAQRIGWQALIEPLGAEWLAATQAVIAYRYHASASIYEDLKIKAARFYADTFGAERDPAELTDDERKQIGRFVAGQLKAGKYPVYRAQFPTVADEVFPAENDKKSAKSKPKDGATTEDASEGEAE